MMAGSSKKPTPVCLSAVALPPTKSPSLPNMARGVLNDYNGMKAIGGGPG